MEDALKATFGNELLFGGPVPEDSTAIHVAVTSTSVSDNEPVILSNYNTGGKERDECKPIVLENAPISKENLSCATGQLT